MKSYVYTSRTRTRNGRAYIHVSLYRIKRNKLTFVGKTTNQFMTELQIVTVIMKECKELPEKHLGTLNTYRLRENRVADIQYI